LRQRIRRKQVPWSVNSSALAFLSEVVKDEEYLERTWALTPGWRKHIVKELADRFPSWTVRGESFLSWLWVDTGEASIAERATTLAKDAGVPIRWGQPGYKQASVVRIAVRHPEHVKLLMDAKADPGCCDSASLSRTLTRYADIFEKSGLEYTAMYGTVLELHRDGRPRQGDDDVDFLVTDLDQAISMLRAHNLSMWTKPKATAISVHDGDNMSKMDVYWGRVMTANVSGVKEKVVCVPWDRAAFPYRMLFPTAMRPFDLGDSGRVKIRTPADPLGFIKYRYGESWRTPLKKGEYRLAEQGRKLYREVCG